MLKVGLAVAISNTFFDSSFFYEFLGIPAAYIVAVQVFIISAVLLIVFPTCLIPGQSREAGIANYRKKLKFMLFALVFNLGLAIGGTLLVIALVN
ncbi:hypothetical protein D1224_03270 [Henriciella barbarensis]|uniref:Uncharacterized protein n=1 Tax=Henriciella barbarensis TaxID=86342 RepID=A0A399QWP1_9PROT|nr:hypothetical protein D1224_03270 [Henriciella barbarensis]